MNLAAMVFPDGAPAARYGEFPERLDRDYEARLLALTAVGARDVEAWRAVGPPFFMAGLAVMLASVHGENRRELLDLAEALYPGASRPEAFRYWLRYSPVRPSRFLPMYGMESRHAA